MKFKEQAEAVVHRMQANAPMSKAEERYKQLRAAAFGYVTALTALIKNCKGRATDSAQQLSATRRISSQ